MVAAPLVGFGLLAEAAENNGVVLVENGQAKAMVCVPAGLMAKDATLKPDAHYRDQRAEMDRRRLRDSVRDLIHYVKVMSGAELSLREGRAPADEKLVPVYVGDLARDVFGPPTKSYPYEQGWRLAVGPQGIGLIGESNLAASYALYEVLDRLGCRWYMPGDLGECIPRSATLHLAETDLSATPSTVYRGLWSPATRSSLGSGFVSMSGNEPFNRRNRQGGRALHGGHGLEKWVTAEQRKAHPEWRAVVNGKPDPVKLKWTRPDVAEAIARNIIALLDKTYYPLLNLGPIDSVGWDESEDPAHDAGDWDTTQNVVSKTDRYLILVNRIAAKVGEKYPDVYFSAMFYVDYTRPPVREKVSPNVIPYICPITYNRAFPMDWPKHPNGTVMLDIVKGWQKASPNIGYYWYAYNLSETWAPNPFITKYSHDLPVLFGPAAKYPYWFPETMSNFETTMIGLNLGMRLSWDASQKPEDVVAELIKNFYGAAAEPMGKYWHLMDRAWVNSPDFSGAAWGYRRRFTPEVMKQARALIDEALAACQTVMEYRRMELADASLRQFERFMKMEKNLAEGIFWKLGRDFDTWWGTAHGLAERYKDNCAFYERFTYRYRWIERPHGRVFRDAARLAADFTVLTKRPLREWRYCADKESVAEEKGWLQPGYDDAAWKTTDVTVDTWSYLGYHSYFGKMAYRTTLALPKVPQGKRVYLWLSRTDGDVKVFVNGVHVPWRTEEGEERAVFSGYATPISFDITAVARPGAKNDVAILCDRAAPNEIGVGGLLGPAVIYCEK